MRRLNSTVALVFCLGLLLGACARAEEPPAPPGPPPVVRVPVPPAEKLAAAEKELKDIYKTEYAKSDAPSRAAFAKELLKQAPGMKDDLAAAYVMLRDARESATTGRDVETALAAAKALGERFEVDAGELKTASFATAAKQNLPADAADKAFTAGLDLLDELERDDRYEDIEKVSLGLETLRRCVGSPALVSQAADRLKDIRTRQFKWQQVKSHLARLKEKPDDPDANLAVGRYYAEVKRDFPKALPFLAKGSDAALKVVSQKDLANPADLGGRVAVGDAWWEAGEKETSSLKGALRLRAVFWYEQIVNDLTGLKKAVVQKRIDQASTVAQAGVRPLPITWKEGVIRVIKGSARGLGFIPMGRLGFTRDESAKGPAVFVIYDLETGERVRETPVRLQGVTWALAPDGRTMLVVGLVMDKGQHAPFLAMGYAFVDLMTGVVSALKEFPFAWLDAHRQCAYGPDGEAVGMGVADRERKNNRQYCVVRLRDNVDAARPVPPVPDGVFRWLPERKEILVYDGKQALFYDAKTGKEKRTVKMASSEHTFVFASGDGVRCTCVVSPDGNLLFQSGRQARSPWWAVADLRTGRWLYTGSLEGPGADSRAPQGLTFLPDSRRMAGVASGRFCVWDAATWKELYSLPGDTQRCAISSDGRFALLDGAGAVQLVGLPKSLWPGAGN